MASSKTWERRVIKPLINALDKYGAEIIAGVQDSTKGHVVFAEEVLTEAEEARLHRAIDKVRGQLARSYGSIDSDSSEDETASDEALEAVVDESAHDELEASEDVDVEEDLEEGAQIAPEVIEAPVQLRRVQLSSADLEVD